MAERAPITGEAATVNNSSVTMFANSPIMPRMASCVLNSAA